MNMHFPIGGSDFRKIRDNKNTYIDKSLFINEVFQDGADAILLLRPRRFGKSLNLSMLQHFLAAQVNGLPTSHLFNELKINKTPTISEQGQHIVVSISLKEMHKENYSDNIAYYRILISKTYSKYEYLLYSDKINKVEKKIFNELLEREGSIINLSLALYTLTELLYQHHDRRVWVLIDEYDIPLTTAYHHHYYPEMINFMRGCLSPLLKDNSYLHKAVITGILRISKESLFSGINNMKVYSMLENQYAQHYGFTETEVIDILEQSGLSAQFNAVKTWYNGYKVDNTVLYNPWSISNFVDSVGHFDLYWVNTAEEKLLKKIITHASDDAKEKIEAPFRGECIVEVIDVNVTFPSLMDSDTAVWSMLYLSGYLRILSANTDDGECIARLDFPNYEIRRLFRTIVFAWLAPTGTTSWFTHFITNLLEGDVEKFSFHLQQIMSQVASSHDVARSPECFCHGLMMGLTAYLYQHPSYVLSSNRESDKGRYDYLILAKDPRQLSVLFEFKKTERFKKKFSEDVITDTYLMKEAEAALRQIDERQHVAYARQHTNGRILKIGLAFHGKAFAVASAYDETSRT